MTDEPDTGEATGSQRTRERLVTAAKELLREIGPARLRVQDVARRAGLTTGALYAHFRDKQDLMAAAVHSAQTDFIAGLVAPTPVASAHQLFTDETFLLETVPTAEHLGELLTRALTREPEQSAELLVESFAMALHPDSAPELAATTGKAHESTIRQAERLRATGRLAENVTPAAFTTLFETLIYGAAVHAALGAPRSSPEELAPLLNAVAKAMLAAPESD
ncbi:TetR/AcrR family transcriptional regulator [Prauserella endophytica]|uniref:TetR/AcrR family transcriptional regulator n=1 Tax=Prauserella endophytica TaxID=1592324 RepID=A0ABY2SB72_9PSEU|nr:TetR/AcrR family transcriptional regulator [Prauserella endophytica]PXY34594.1 hypothetical protein BAY59_03480 [Prauserella coralliicola]TKG73133.1 TetR/AcrR family transcriptional regulator [Prauserella endophytica]